MPTWRGPAPSAEVGAPSRESSTWLQVLNRAVPEKLNAEKKTITGRTFKR